MKINFNGVNDLYATFYITEDVKKGDIVAISDEMTVDVATSTGIFTGICVATNGNIGTIRLAGYTELSYSGTAPTLGVNFLKADGNGGVVATNAGTGRNVLVVGLDTTEKIVKFILF